MAQSQHFLGHQYQGFVTSGHARVIAGNVHGDVHIDAPKKPEDVILDSLHFEGMERYHERPLDSYPGTFEWLFDQQLCDITCDRCIQPHCQSTSQGSRYLIPCGCSQLGRNMRVHAAKLQAWLQSSNDIFWINGKAGSGKSTFMKFLFEHERTRQYLNYGFNGDVTIVAFFFWNAGSELEKSQIGLLRALLYQILSKHPEVISLIFPRRCLEVARPSTSNKPWTTKELLEGLRLVSKSPVFTKRICLLIDGLDEFDGDYRDLIEGLDALNVSPTTKICVSSRPWSVFKAAYGSDQRHCLALHELTARDIDIYVTARLELSRCRSSTLNQSELAELSKDVRGKAAGVFLWVMLVVRDLRRGIDEDDSMIMLRKRLHQYPSEIRDFVRQMLDKIDPTYKQFTGRLLLTMLSRGGAAPLALVHLWEQPGNYEEGLLDTRWSPKGFPEMHHLLDKGISCVNKWCKDLLSPIDSHHLHRRCGHQQPERGMDVFLHPSVHFSHQMIYHFIMEMAMDGTLRSMAGDGFDPNLARLRLSVDLASWAPDLHDFMSILEDALLRLVRHSALISVCSLMRVAGDPSGTKVRLLQNVRSILGAFDRIGQNIVEPLKVQHWIVVAFERVVSGRPMRVLHRMPLDLKHITLTAYMLRSWPHLDDFIEWALSSQPDSMTIEEKRFALACVLNPALLEVSSDSPWPHRTLTNIVKSDPNVNQPTHSANPKSNCSIWQIFLLWLNNFFNSRGKFIYSVECVLQHCVSVFRDFLSSSADPFTVVSSEDLVAPCYDCSGYDSSCQECRRPKLASAMSATEILAEAKEIACQRSWTDAIPVIEAMQKLLADAALQKRPARASRLP